MAAAGYYFVMTELELAYLAGVIDSDGAISIIIDRWRTKTGGKSPAYQEFIAIQQVQTEALEMLAGAFGGRVRWQKPQAVTRKPTYAWDLRNKSAVGAIRSLLPFLRIKRRQAEIVLALRAIKDRGRKANTEARAGVLRTRFLRPTVLAEMESLARQVRALNDTRHALLFPE